jgi:hypothetical protein
MRFWSSASGQGDRRRRNPQRTPKDAADADAPRGWRRELLGGQGPALKHGKLMPPPQTVARRPAQASRPMAVKAGLA